MSKHKIKSGNYRIKRILRKIQGTYDENFTIMAEKLGVSNSYLCHIANGKSPLPAYILDRLQANYDLSESVMKELKKDNDRLSSRIMTSIKQFNFLYNIEYNSKVDPNPTLDKYGLRYELMKEENDEYLESLKNNDVIGVADALGDMLYILYGTILAHGMQHVIEEVFDEIHESNLSKLGEDGKPIYREDGKVIKGPNYFPPNLDKIIKYKKEE